MSLPPATPLAVSSSGELALALGTHSRGIMTYGTLARVPLAGGAPRELLEDVKYADWSPDGRELAVIRRVAGREQLEFPIGNVVAEPESPGGGFSFLRMSPQGDRVAVFALTFAGGLTGNVAVVDRAGNKRIVSRQYFNCFGLSWKGDEIWFSAADERPLFRNTIHAITQDGAARVVVRTAGNVSLHDVAPDGRALIAHTNDRTGISVMAPGAVAEQDHLVARRLVSERSVPRWAFAPVHGERRRRRAAQLDLHSQHRWRAGSPARRRLRLGSLA